MNVLIFKQRFAEAIIAGEKTHTIRPHRKDGRARVADGEIVSIRVWTGLPYRSKQKEICQRKIHFTIPVRVEHAGVLRVDIGAKLSSRIIALGDGFKSWPEMRSWFKETHGLPFEGVLIVWHRQSGSV